jgi:hypothetical protein
VCKIEEVLRRVKEERNLLHTINGRKANWIGHILRRNCLLKHVEERHKGREDEEEDARGYRITLRKRENRN